jgi:SOS response regulatory protein OraA/RecX
MSSSRPTLTRLRRTGPGRIALEVDGRPWRVVSDEVVARCGLAVGVELDRPLLRRLRGELLRADAVESAARALARRDLARRAVTERLRRRGVPRATEETVLATLTSAGLLDDARLARARARTLAERGWGDEAIAARLEQEGIAEADAAAALAGLAGESERAAELVAQESDRRRAARFLARRGFAFETIEDVVGPVDDGDCRELR